jgi:branched-chain amino acid aminotransferase
MLVLLTDTRLDLARSGARHGQGLFETVRMRDGAPQRLGAHLERLAAGARFLGLEPPPGTEAVLAFLAARRVGAGLALGVLRLVAVDRALYAFAQPWVPRRPRRVEVGLSRGLRRFSPSPLNRFKTMSCLENRLLAREAADRGLFEVLALNEAGRLTDGSRTTLFAVLGGRLVTPPAADGALPGVARRCLLEAGLGAESALAPEDLERAEALLLTNALWGAVPVHRGPGGRSLAAGHPLLGQAAALLQAPA